MDTPQIEWRLTTADKSYNPFEVDKTNINTALGRLGGYDILAKQEELDAVNHDLTLPVTPDDITQPIASRLHGLCNSADKKPLMFKAEYNARSPDEGLTSMYIQIPVYDGQPAEDAKYKAWMRTDLNWFDCIRALNKVPYASRGEVRFLFMVTFGNAPGGLKWSVGRWMEVGMHEIGVHVIQGLHFIELYRKGLDWPEASSGDIDHLMFRLTGYKRYSFWLHKLLKELSGAHQQDLHQAVMEWEKKEEHRDQYAWGLVTDIYRGITNSRTSCEYMKCWALAGRFPVQDFKLVKGVESAGTLMVDKEHSKDFLVGLKAQMDRVFVYEEGKSASTHVKAFAWWK